MRVEVRLPELGEDVEGPAKVSFWYVDKSENTNEGDDLIEMVTDKATFNVPSPVSGALVEVNVGEGDEVNVGDLMGVIETED